MLKTDNCCCCASLRTGTLIIGWLYLVANVLAFIGNIVNRLNGTDAKDSTGADYLLIIENGVHLQNGGDRFRMGVGALFIYTAFFMNRAPTTYTKSVTTILNVNALCTNNDTFWPNIVTYVLSILLAVSLLYGVYTNRKRFIYYYLFVSVAVLVLKVLIVIVALIMGSFAQVSVIIVGSLISWAITVYLLVVVYSYHEELAGHN